MTASPLRAYHLTSAEHAISSISLCRLKVARISEVNDPFELFALNCMRKDVRKALHNFRAEQDGQVGLLCFSERWKNPVLWSHYAAKHRGICLGFDIDRTIGVRGVQQVLYDPSKLKIPSDAQPSLTSLPDDVQQQLFVTKFEHWDYEEEWRVVVRLSEAQREGSLFFYPFSERLRLREVILGPLCPLSLLEPIRKIVRAQGHAATVSRARLGFKFFEVKEDARYPPR